MTISSDSLKALPCRCICFVEPTDDDRPGPDLPRSGQPREWTMHATEDRPIQVRFLFEKKVVVLVVGVTQYIFKLSTLCAIDVVAADNLWRLRWWSDIQMKTVRPDGVQDGGFDHTEGRIFRERCLAFQLVDVMAPVQNYDTHYTPAFFAYPIWRDLIHIHADRTTLPPAQPWPLWSASLFSIANLGLVLDRPEELDRFKTVLSHLPQLDVLHLGGNSMSGYVVQALCRMLSQSPCLNSIRKLSMRNLFHGRTVLDKIKALQHLNTLLQTQCASLIELDLGDNPFHIPPHTLSSSTTASTASSGEAKGGAPPTSSSGTGSSGGVSTPLDLLKAALPLMTLKRLEILRAANCELGEEGGAMFGNWLSSFDPAKPPQHGNSALHHYPHLAKNASVAAKQVTGLGVTALPLSSGVLAARFGTAALYDGPPLRIIDFSRNFLTDACAKALAEGLGYLANTLTELHLAHNGLTSAGLTVMIDNGLRLCTRLHVLDLNDNPLGDASAAQVLLGGMNCWPHLKTLKLNRSRMNMSIFLQGLPHVARELEEFEVSGNRLTEEQLDCLLPMCPAQQQPTSLSDAPQSIPTLAFAMTSTSSLNKGLHSASMPSQSAGVLRYVDVTGAMRCPALKAQLRARLQQEPHFTKEEIKGEDVLYKCVVEEGQKKRYGLRDAWSCEDNADATPTLISMDQMPPPV